MWMRAWTELLCYRWGGLLAPRQGSTSFIIDRWQRSCTLPHRICSLDEYRLSRHSNGRPQVLELYIDHRPFRSTTPHASPHNVAHYRASRLETIAPYLVFAFPIYTPHHGFKKEGPP